jgi:hypothetical protein
VPPRKLDRELGNQVMIIKDGNPDKGTSIILFFGTLLAVSPVAQFTIAEQK